MSLVYTKECKLMNSSLTHKLLLRIQSGDVDAAAALFAEYANVLYWRARKKYTLSHEDAMDVVQTTFRKLLESIDSYDPEKAGGPSWIWRIFSNAAIDILRRKPTEEFTDDLIENVLRGETEDLDPIEHAEEQELCKIARKAFQLLSEADRKEILRGRGKAGRKRASLCRAEENLRRIFFGLYQ
jgi:RNA polymerase sigma factor (sigma-70 family)